MLTAQS
jgi:hypothetical protein